MNNRPFLLTPHPEEFISTGKLLKESWKIFTTRFGTLVGITAVPIAFDLLLFLLTGILGRTLPLTGVVILELILVVGLAFFWILITPALIFSLKENLGIKDSYKKGLKIFLPFLWVVILFGLAISGGFLLFIIPAIIFSVWFSLAIYVLIFEEKRGVATLKRSKELVSGRWWRVFWRVLVPAGIMLIIYLSISFLFQSLFDESLNDVIALFLDLFFFPFSVIYGLLIYQNLVKIKPERVNE